ncbi:three component ABC system middle component [Bacillus sp. FSL R5-0560]|uniref:three component ABC system middle component n=1 Tax=Bacillus sp. FSL R5-0560 TaxID=2954588 RepID=UPI0030CFD69A
MTKYTTLYNSIARTELYNNEILGVIALYSVISRFSSISPAKVMLILPIAMHNSLVSYLNDSRTKVMSLGQLIVKKTEFFSNFNRRYYSLLDVSMNSLLILIKLGLVSFDENGNIVPNKEANEYTRLIKQKKMLGKRANNIINASSAIAKLISMDNNSLYFELRVKI